MAKERNMEQEFKKFMNNYRGSLAKQRRAEAKERAKTQRLEDTLKKMSQDFSDVSRVAAAKAKSQRILEDGFIGDYKINNLTAKPAPQEETVEIEANTTEEAPTNVDTAQTVDTDMVEYTYKPGDTFGQVINDLGLRTNNGLWGANGDVAYYTQQLVSQGVLDRNGNIPIGTTIKLRRRK